ncbi:hypothetical protein GGX14DRAFT_667767 [Mycena pura]|uniref:CxC5 like cysteine cluster associated with KDZ domain-containing protein n=1 Tax=Mycena pura TaxID=153505 RepID=A0AAD6V1W0_9AGAR|nr:hypothetical protein GGX14DRAFT_667767 [Mycena pura]
MAIMSLPKVHKSALNPAQSFLCSIKPAQRGVFFELSRVKAHESAASRTQSKSRNNKQRAPVGGLQSVCGGPAAKSKGPGNFLTFFKRSGRSYKEVTGGLVDLTMHHGRIPDAFKSLWPQLLACMLVECTGVFLILPLFSPDTRPILWWCNLDALEDPLDAPVHSAISALSIKNCHQEFVDGLAKVLVLAPRLKKFAFSGHHRLSIDFLATLPTHSLTIHLTTYTNATLGELLTILDSPELDDADIQYWRCTPVVLSRKHFFSLPGLSPFLLKYHLYKADVSHGRYTMYKGIHCFLLNVIAATSPTSRSRRSRRSVAAVRPGLAGWGKSHRRPALQQRRGTLPTRVVKKSKKRKEGVEEDLETLRNIICRALRAELPLSDDETGQPNGKVAIKFPQVMPHPDAEFQCTVCDASTGAESGRVATLPTSSFYQSTSYSQLNSSRGKHMSYRGKRTLQLPSDRDHPKTGRRTRNLTEEERLAKRRASREKWRVNNSDAQRAMSRKAMAKKRNRLKAAGGRDWVDYHAAAAEHSRKYRSRKQMDASASGSRKRQKKCGSTDEEEDAHDEDNVDSQWLYRLRPRGPPSAAPTNITAPASPLRKRAPASLVRKPPPSAAPTNNAAPTSPLRNRGAKAAEDEKPAAKDACQDVEPHVDVHDFNEPASLLDIHHAQSDDEEHMPHLPARQELLFLPGTSDQEEPPARFPSELRFMVASRSGPVSRGSPLARSPPARVLTPAPEVPLPVVLFRDETPPVPPPADYFRYGWARGLSSLVLYPPSACCTNPDCPSEIPHKKAEPRQVVVYTLDKGVRHLSCLQRAMQIIIMQSLFSCTTAIRYEKRRKWGEEGEISNSSAVVRIGQGRETTLWAIYIQRVMAVKRNIWKYSSRAT